MKCICEILDKSLPVIFGGVILMLVAQEVLAGQTFTVTNTNDDGGGSLRQAILEANANPGLDVIAFNISGRSRASYTIQPRSPLPHITDPVIIDGYTQPGASPNTNGPVLGSNAMLKIELDGSMAGANFVHGLHIIAGSSSVRGMAINRFSGNGIAIFGNEATGNLAQGNFIGTDVTGTVDLGNSTDGVQIRGAANNTIGGITAEARNVISGNNVRGISIMGDVNTGGSDAMGNLVQGNLIGTDITGTAALGNTQDGVQIRGAANNTIGGTTAGARNVISGNNTGGGWGGVSIINHPTLLITGASGNLVQGNFIGTDVTGTTALGNGSGGVIIEAAANNSLTDNTISNNGYGIRLESSSDNQIYNNNFIDNTTQAYANTGRGGNIFNLEKPIGGNYWSDWMILDADGDGLVDSPYVFTGGVDHLPWARQDGWLPPPPPPPILPDIAVTGPNLIGWWKFDGSGTTAIDSSGNGFDIPLHNTRKTTWEDGVFGGALHFHGVGYGYVENLNYSDNAITVCAWVRHDAFRIGEIERYITVAPEIAVIRKDWDRSLNFYIKTDGNLGHLWGNDVFREGRWHHVAGTWDGVTQRLYIDGVEIASQVPGGVLGNASNVEMSSEGEPLNGMLDDVRIYNRALRQNGIQVIMQGKEFPYAFSPTPPDGSVLEDTNVTLSWSPGHYADSHDIYFGENFDDVKDGAEGTFRGNQAETFFIVGFPGFPYPDGLVPGTTYYWRIDEVNDTEPNSPWEGNVWSFLIPPNADSVLGHFTITYYDNYNYDTGQWDAWQSEATPRDAWDDKYLADGSSGNTVYTDHAFTSITTFDLRGGLFSKDGHASDGEDWNPLQSIGDTVSGQSSHHVFAALFKGLIYLEEGDNLMVASDDDVYVFLDGYTAWGQEVLSIPLVSHFGTDSMTVTAAQEGYHTITVEYIERLNDHSGIEITVNGEHIQNAEVSGLEDFETGNFSKFSW